MDSMTAVVHRDGVLPYVRTCTSITHADYGCSFVVKVGRQAGRQADAVFSWARNKEASGAPFWEHSRLELMNNILLCTPGFILVLWKKTNHTLIMLRRIFSMAFVLLIQEWKQASKEGTKAERSIRWVGDGWNHDGTSGTCLVGGLCVCVVFFRFRPSSIHFMDCSGARVGPLSLSCRTNRYAWLALDNERKREFPLNSIQ